MSTTPEPASPKPTPRPAEPAETTDAAAKPPTDATQTGATPQPASAAPDDGSSSEEPTPGETSQAEDVGGEPEEAEEQGSGRDEADSESGSASKDEGESDEERQRSTEEFAAQHDPADHDIAAGEEFRQPGDWTAEDGEGGGEDGGSAGTGGRRVAELEEVRDGGYSVGSAATIHDGAMPLGHPVKAWEDTKTFVTEEHEHYEEAEPHVWFADAEAAERAGFRPAD